MPARKKGFKFLSPEYRRRAAQKYPQPADVDESICNGCGKPFTIWVKPKGGEPGYFKAGPCQCKKQALRSWEMRHGLIPHLPRGA